MRNERGNVLIEFAMSFFIIMAFLWGLLGIGMWGLGSIYTKAAANEAALVYARTEDLADARSQVEKVLDSGGKVFLKQNYTLTAGVSGTTAHVSLTTYPKFKRLFIFTKPSITYRAEAVLEDYYRNPGQYER